MLIVYRLKAYSVKSANRAAYIPMSKDRGFTRLLITPLSKYIVLIFDLSGVYLIFYQIARA